MKKILLIILLAVYSSSTIGVTLHFHYCCGILEKVDFTGEQRSGCNKGTASHCHSKLCCEDRQEEIKVTDVQQLSKIGFNSLPVYVLPVSYDYSIRRFSARKLLVSASYNRLLSHPQRLYLLNCDFRI